MKTIVEFGALEVGAKFEDIVGNTWIKTVQINWLGSDTRRYIRNAVVLESAYPENPGWKSKPGHLGEFDPENKVRVISPDV